MFGDLTFGSSYAAQGASGIITRLLTLLRSHMKFLTPASRSASTIS